MIKLHLLDSDAPHAEGTDVVVNCGATVKSAVALRANDWAEGQCGEWLDRMNVCQRCRLKAMEPKAARYTYRLVPGQQGLDLAAETR